MFLFAKSGNCIDKPSLLNGFQVLFSSVGYQHPIHSPRHSFIHSSFNGHLNTSYTVVSIKNSFGKSSFLIDECFSILVN